MSKARARRIKLILFDVDGVLTDGKIWIFATGAQQTTQAHVAKYILKAQGKWKRVVSDYIREEARRVVADRLWLTADSGQLCRDCGVAGSVSDNKI
jgi:FMN phosphatase YigB (HAD superfamily)